MSKKKSDKKKSDKKTSLRIVSRSEKPESEVEGLPPAEGAISRLMAALGEEIGGNPLECFDEVMEYVELATFISIEYSPLCEMSRSELIEWFINANEQGIPLKKLINRISFPPLDEVYQFEDWAEIHRFLDFVLFECPECRNLSRKNTKCDPSDKSKKSCGHNLVVGDGEYIQGEFNYIIKEAFKDQPAVLSSFMPILQMKKVKRD